MSAVRVGVVSATGTGRKRTLPALRDSEVCVVTAVHGRDPAKVTALAEEFGVPNAYTDLNAMISEAKFDFAVVCSPPFLHVEQVSALLRAGIPTLCEKPLALREDEALAGC